MSNLFHKDSITEIEGSIKTTHLIAVHNEDVVEFKATVEEVKSALHEIEVSNTISTKTDSHTLALVDSGKVLLLNAAGAETLTVPLNATVAFPVGTRIHLSQIGAGLFPFI